MGHYLPRGGSLRVLHTSDWHLGRDFGGTSLAQDHQSFLDWLVALCEDRSIDLVVVAGDVYDRAVPPSESLVWVRGALHRLRRAGHTVAIITGNHDAADRVASYGNLLDGSGIYIRGGYAQIGEVLRLDFRDGPIDLVLLPFLDPQAAPDDLIDPSDPSSDEEAFDRRIRRTHQSVLGAAIAAARRSLTSPRSLAVSHAFVAGGATSESERLLSLGGAGTVDAALFDGFSYVALGHLHRPQNVSPTIRYSGTPLAYSFSEEHAKSVTIIEMAPDGSCATEEIAVPMGRPVRTVTGTLESLLASGVSAAAVGAFVRAVLTDRGVVLDAKRKLAQVYPHVVEIVLSPADGVGAAAGGSAPIARTASPSEVAEAFWRESTGDAPAPQQRALLHEAIREAERESA